MFFDESLDVFQVMDDHTNAVDCNAADIDRVFSFFFFAADYSEMC